MNSCGKKARRRLGNRYACKRARRHERNLVKIAEWKRQEQGVERSQKTKEKYGL